MPTTPWNTQEIATATLVTAPDGSFQFRNDGAEKLHIIAVTMPPWPGDGEALVVNGAWTTTA
jgi:mannose-6-phosphate isomerase-like protein (cupin superfamily)